MTIIFLFVGILATAIGYEKGGKTGALLLAIVVLGMAYTAQKKGII